ncbi:hypothetical protein GRI62_03430 [Erythrobacter arachoides]|uniref:Spore coat protein U domain-containing protein n=1 Tax=Aurantiacibacter arachoides TaxID=1850444 RepID=A0A844ZY65_9SPHN|nr:hypothetical protein [Aurantiacibacter arachoides]MXO92658.1 hypothetical protein [Aurantiacibacter arachoides]GGD55421.1 hypothetical protein GCM10011411_14290 [Aurantiacibacter arachoides]
MKFVMRAALATTAIVSMGGVAQAQTHSIVNPVNESVTIPVTTQTTTTTIVSQRPNPSFGQGNNNQSPFITNGCPNNPACVSTPVTTTTSTTTNEVQTSFTISGSAANDTEAATPTVANTFTLTGTVSRDCSFYAGNTNAARTIDFGTIGVRTGNNENVNAAFEMAGPATATVQTLTAGCNTNNSVEVSKNDIRGMVNANPGGYDTDEFQANIPYAVTASWTGVGLNAVTTGTQQGFTVPTTGNAGSLQQGAWRSAMEIAFNAPAITDRGLVAGTYSGTTTVTLRAL